MSTPSAPRPIAWLTRAVLFFLVIVVAARCVDDEAITPPDPQAARAPAQGEDIFTIIQPPSSIRSGRPQQKLSAIQTREYHVETFIARFASGGPSLLRAARPIVIQVSPTKRYVVSPERVEEHQPTEPGEEPTISWYGSLQRVSDSPRTVPGSFQAVSGSFSLSVGVTGTNIYGGIQDLTNHVVYDIEGLGDGLAAISQVDPSEFRGEEAGVSLSFNGGAFNDLFRSISSTGAEAIALAGTTIDLYIARTTAVNDEVSTSRNGPTRNTINQAFINSTINANVVNVKTGPVTYDETGRTMHQHLASLVDPNDGVMDIVHPIRDDRDADVVILLVDGPEGAGAIVGLVTEIPATAATAFLVVHYNWAAASGRWTAAHELGHLMGARHENDGNGPARGHFNEAQGWYTLMTRNAVTAVDGPCTGCDRIQFYSDPNKPHPQTGTPLGTSSRNNAARLRVTKGTVANFRGPPPPPPPLSVSIEGPRTVGPGDTCTWRAVGSGGAGGYSYQWSGGLVSGSGFQKTATVNQSSGIVVTVTDANNMTNSTSIGVIVNPTAPFCGGS